MHTTRIFLGSSEELRGDRLALTAFINSVNNACVPYGQRFVLVVWEHESIAIARHEAGKQAEYDDLVRGCDACLFLFHTKCGAYTMEEVYCALDEQKRRTYRALRIFTWMRALAAGEHETPELTALKERIAAGTLSLPYQMYDDVRTIELALLQAFVSWGVLMAPQHHGDFVYVGDEAVIDLG